jgi:hypothetical protein
MIKRFVVTVSVLSVCCASLVSAQPPERFFDLPKFAVAPVLDGDRSTVANEWANALEFECSPSQILRDGAEFGWRDIEQASSEVSANQLVVNGETEDAAIGRTDADYASVILQAWDDEGIYYLVEARDNIHDVEGGGVAEHWWERDSMSLYLDLNNEDHPGGDPTGEYVNLGIINTMATPFGSTPYATSLATTVQGVRVFSIDPETVEGIDYAYRDAGDEFGGEADYVIESKVAFDTLIRGGNLFERPTAGSEMGFTWLGVDPDGEEAYGGQIQCVAWAGGNQSEFANWVFVDALAGPETGASAVQADSWARIKSTFAN